MKAVIMAGGKGTRLSSITKAIPKPMVLLGGKPVLQYQIENLRNCGIVDIYIITGHLSDVIEVFFGNGKKFGVNINYFTETIPLGTAGALAYLKESLQSDFLLLMGDLFITVDFKRFINRHMNTDAMITLFSHPNSHPYDSDLLMTDDDDRVTGWLSKKDTRKDYYKNLVNAGLYIINPKLLDKLDEGRNYDLDKEIIAPSIVEGYVYAYKSTEYVKDIGTPERLHSVESDIKNGIPQSRCLNKKQKCIFLDRDGTINKHKGFINNTEEFELEAHVIDAIKKINESEYLAVVVSNQPVIARGECTFEELNQIHRKMETLLGEKGAYIDGIYFCPHHTDKGFEGEVPELKINCDCRKPKTGMLKRAARDMNIDLSASWMIGDTTVDIKTGENADMKTCLVLTGEAGNDLKYSVTPDITCINLLESVNTIIGG